ncbi:MAG TPA: hypothetical protein VJ576_12345 [Rhodocyclaceae bacterium]|nr:hypothetical protein [Rhodocyclaceae bacterium]
MKPFKALLPAIIPGLVLCGAAGAAEGRAAGEGRIVLAGEILVGPDRNETRTPGARTQRERAGAYSRGTEVVVPVEEEGFLSPRGGAPTEEKAFENRVRSRAYQQGLEAPVVIPGMPVGNGDIAMPATSQERARDLRSRARVYTGTGNVQEIDLSRVGADGIPVIPCGGDVENAAARIGDDAASGSVFVIMRQGKPVKVRCK